MSEVNPVQFGRMLRAMEELTERLERVDERLGQLEDRWHWGKGAVFGVILTLGCALYGLKEMLGKFIGIGH